MKEIEEKEEAWNSLHNYLNALCLVPNRNREIILMMQINSHINLTRYSVIFNITRKSLSS